MLNGTRNLAKGLQNASPASGATLRRALGGADAQEHFQPRLHRGREMLVDPRLAQAVKARLQQLLSVGVKRG